MTRLARYKCVALNRLGRDQLEFSLRVLARERPTAADALVPGERRLAPGSREKPSTAGQRDQRAGVPSAAPAPLTSEASVLSPLDDSPNSAARKHKGLAAKAARGQHGANGNSNSQPARDSQATWSQLKQAAETAAASVQTHQIGQQQQTNWIRTGAAIQVVLVAVSVLMGAVVLAFLVVCVIIYQIKPSGQQAGCQLVANPLLEPPAAGQPWQQAAPGPDGCPLDGTPFKAAGAGQTLLLRHMASSYGRRQQQQLFCAAPPSPAVQRLLVVGAASGQQQPISTLASAGGRDPAPGSPSPSMSRPSSGASLSCGSAGPQRRPSNRSSGGASRSSSRSSV